MTKKSSTKVKENRSMSFIELMLAPFKFKTFEKKNVSCKTLGTYSTIMLFLIIGVSILINNISNYSTNNITLFPY